MVNLEYFRNTLNVCIIRECKSAFLFLSLIFYSGNSFAQLDFLFCARDELMTYRSKCTETVCGDCVNGANKSSCLSCIRDRANSCYCLTFLGAKYYRSGQFDFNKFSIYGNFCGWRNASSIWSKKQKLSSEDKVSATLELDAIDSLDEICKRHDLAYVNREINICSADKLAIAEFEQFAYVMKSSSQKAILATVMKETLKMNAITCNVLNFYLNK